MRTAMIDHFAILGQPRRPWLDSEKLRDAFHELSATLHPDVAGSGDATQFAQMNAAYIVLREPAARVRHLLELDLPRSLERSYAIPEILAALFGEIAPLRGRFEAFLRRRNAASTAIARALLASEEQPLRADLSAIAQTLERVQHGALDQLRAIDEEWSAANESPAARLASLHAELAFLAKWNAQLREMLLQFVL